MSIVNPNFYQGKMGYVMVDSSIVAFAKSYSLEVSRDISDIQCLGSDSIRKLSGPYKWKVSFEALQVLTQDASSGTKSLDDILKHHTSSTNPLYVYLKPNTTDVSSGQIYWKGQAVVENINVNVTSGSEPVSYSVSFQGSGSLSSETLS